MLTRGRLPPNCAGPRSTRRRQLDAGAGPCSIGARFTICKRGGTISHSAMRVLEVFFIFLLRRPRKSLSLSYEAIARAALLSRGTVGRTIQRLANLGLITVQGGSVCEITPQGDLGG